MGWQSQSKGVVALEQKIRNLKRLNGTAKFIDEVISDYIDIYFEKCLPMKDRFILETSADDFLFFTNE